MFTGLVEEVGEVVRFGRSSKGGTLLVEAPLCSQGTKLGDSIAVNGVCLTVTKVEGNRLEFFVSPETLKRSNLSQLRPGFRVNLERALKLGDRLGGHLLLGHVDTTTKIEGIRREGDSFLFLFKLPRSFSHLLVEKGSIGIDGISLTVAGLFPTTFSVAVIPHTLNNTNLKFRKPGETVNLEFDVIGKYVVRLAETGRLKGGTTPPGTTPQLLL
ncbi:riboflavin synthase [Thermovibrio ammonificans]